MSQYPTKGTWKSDKADSNCTSGTKLPSYHSCFTHTHTHTHAHRFNGPLTRNTWVSQYQKGKTNLDFTEARDHKAPLHCGISWAICKPQVHSILHCRQIQTTAIDNMHRKFSEVWKCGSEDMQAQITDVSLSLCHHVHSSLGYPSPCP